MDGGDVKTKKFLQLLNWLKNHKNFDIEQGGKHNLKATARYSGDKYPLPTSHKTINKHIVKDFCKWLVKNNICSEDEYFKHL